MRITFATTGTQAVVFLVRSTNPLQGQRSYTVEPRMSLTDDWMPLLGAYDLSVTAPNGFLRRFAGSIALGGTGLQVQETYVVSSRTIRLTLNNGNHMSVQALVTDMYSGDVVKLALASNGNATHDFPLGAAGGWYDLHVTLTGYPTVLVQLAGHLENGSESVTDPMIGA